MCGIIGYLGLNSHQASGVILEGLQRLEYRGYDSAGLATVANGELHLRRTVGHVRALSEHVARSACPGHRGIGHTRWATHGRPSEDNAHPHVDATGRIALVHNGIVENYRALRTFLESQGCSFKSETDTETLVQLIGYFFSQTNDLIDSVRRVMCKAQGALAIAVISIDAPETVIAARRGSPLLVGMGDTEYIVASDASALVARTSRVIYLEDDEVACLGPAGVEVTDLSAQPIEKLVDLLDLQLGEFELEGYEHHMLKEIHQQPNSLRSALHGRIQAEAGRVLLGGLSAYRSALPHCQRTLLFGCGTAWHAALIGEYMFEDLGGVPANVEYASELRYRNPIIEPDTIAIAISQSGETADTLEALREVKSKGAVCLGIVNSVGSSIARETDAGVYLNVGQETGVASTKAFTAQLAVLAMMAIDLGRRKHLSVSQAAQVLEELTRIPDKIEEALQLDRQIRDLAQRLADRDNWLYLGRGINFPVALEGALKLKEISYVHAEGLPAAELKHGPLAMIDAGLPVVVISPQDHAYEKTLANIEEIRSRDGRVIVVATQGDTQVARFTNDVIFVPPTLPILSPMITTIPLQLLAYHIALIRGHDVDKPRNLAKCVTVE